MRSDASDFSSDPGSNGIRLYVQSQRGAVVRADSRTDACAECGSNCGAECSSFIRSIASSDAGS